ncbi:MAG: helix-turn-helix domain-containing protein [Lachnospiraceae bacterium]|nr:helix-turn-helix domain-containing protein [Lachnospiraceae bacterium]
MEVMNVTGINIQDIRINDKKDGYMIIYQNTGRKKPGRKPNISKDEILKLRQEGLSYRKIADIVGCSFGYVREVIKEKESTTYE